MHDFIIPNNDYITSYYQKRTHPISGEVGKMHWGIDFGSLSGSDDILAIADGTVRIAEMQKGYGNVVLITHNVRGVSYESLYAHLASFNVKAGRKVKQGQLIGKKGNTGSSTAKHLHFELFNGYYRSDYKNTLNPLLYVFDPNTLELQQMLNKTAPFNLKEDGYRGEQTINAIAVYQKRAGLGVDGYAGANTFNKLKEEVKSISKVASSTSTIKKDKTANTGTAYITFSGTLKKQYQEYLKEAINQKILQPKWLEDYNAGRLTTADALHLNIFIRKNLK